LKPLLGSPTISEPLLNFTGQRFVTLGRLKKCRAGYRLKGKFGLGSHFFSPIPPILYIVNEPLCSDFLSPQAHIPGKNLPI
jgi:hypothetical protein